MSPPPVNAVSSAGAAAGSAPRGYGTWNGSLLGGTVTATPSQPDGSGRAQWTVTLQRGATSVSTQVALTGQFSAKQLTSGSAAKSALEAQLSPPRGVSGAATAQRLGSHNRANAAASSEMAALSNAVTAQQNATHPNHGSEHVSALKNTLAGYASGGLSATDLRIARDAAREVLGDPKALGTDSRRYLEDFYRQAQGKLQAADAQAQSKAQAQAQARRQAAEAGDAAVRKLGEAIGAFDRGAGRDTLNAALAQARNANKSGWTAAQLKGFKAYEAQASTRLWPKANRQLAPNERALARDGAAKARELRGQQQAKAPPRVADVKIPVGAQAPNGQGLQGDLVRINARQWGLKGSTSLYRVPEHIQDKQAAIAYAKQQIRAGGWGQLRSLDPRFLGGADAAQRGKQTAQYLKGLRQLIDIAGQEASDGAMNWAELANTRNNAQKVLDLVRKSFGDDVNGLALYERTQSELNRIYDQVLQRQINAGEGQRRVQALMARYRSDNQQRIARFGGNAETSSTVAKATIATSTVAGGWLAVGIVAPAGGAVAGTAATLRTVGTALNAARSVSPVVSGGVGAGFSAANRGLQNTLSWGVNNLAARAGQTAEGPDKDVIAKANPLTRERLVEDATGVATDAVSVFTGTAAAKYIVPVATTLVAKAAPFAAKAAPLLAPLAPLVQPVVSKLTPLAQAVQQTVSNLATRWGAPALPSANELIGGSLTGAGVLPLIRWSSLAPSSVNAKVNESLQRSDLQQAQAKLQGAHPGQRDAALQQTRQQWQQAKKDWIARYRAEFERQVQALGSQADPQRVQQARVEQYKLINDEAYARFEPGQQQALGAQCSSIEARYQLQLGQLQDQQRALTEQTDKSIADQVSIALRSTPSDALIGGLGGLLVPSVIQKAGAPRGTLQIRPLPLAGEMALGAGQGGLDTLNASKITGAPITAQDLAINVLSNMVTLPTTLEGSMRAGNGRASTVTVTATAPYTNLPNTNVQPTLQRLAEVQQRLAADPTDRTALQQAKQLRTQLGKQLESIERSLDLNQGEQRRLTNAQKPEAAAQAARLIESLKQQRTHLLAAWRPVGRATGLDQPRVRLAQHQSPLVAGSIKSVEMVVTHGPRALMVGGGVTLGMTGANVALNLVHEVRTGPPIVNASQELAKLVSDPDYMKKNYADPAGNVPGHVFVEQVDGKPRLFITAPLDLYQRLYAEEVLLQGNTDTPGTLWRDARLPDGRQVLVEVRPPFRDPSQWKMRYYFQTEDPANPYNAVSDVRLAFGPVHGRSTELTVSSIRGSNTRNDTYLHLGLDPLTLKPNWSGDFWLRQQSTTRPAVASAKFAPISFNPGRVENLSVPSKNSTIGFEAGSVVAYSLLGVRDLQHIQLNPQGTPKVIGVFRGTGLWEPGIAYLPVSIFGTHGDGSAWTVTPLQPYIEFPMYPLDARLTADPRSGIRPRFTPLNLGLPEVGLEARARGVVPNYLSPTSWIEGLSKAYGASDPLPLPEPQPYLPAAVGRPRDDDSGDPATGVPVAQRRPGTDPQDRPPPTTQGGPGGAGSNGPMPAAGSGGMPVHDASRALERGYGTRFAVMQPSDILRTLQKAGHGAAGVVKIEATNGPPVFALVRNDQRTIRLRVSGEPLEIALSAALGRAQWAAVAGLDAQQLRAVSFLRTDTRRYVPPPTPTPTPKPLAEKQASADSNERRLGQEPLPPQSVGAAAKPKAPRVSDWPQFAQGGATPDAVIRAAGGLLPASSRQHVEAGAPTELVQVSPAPPGLRSAWARSVTQGVSTMAQARSVHLRELAAYYRSGVNPALANRRAFLEGVLQSRPAASDNAQAVVFMEIPGVLKPINDHVGHVAADKLVVQVLNTAADVARQHPGVTVYQLDALRLAVEGNERDTAAFADAFAARVKSLQLSYVASGTRYSNQAPGVAADGVRQGLPVVRAELDTAAAGSRRELLFQGIDALDRASEPLKLSKAEGGTAELDPERGAHLRDLKQDATNDGDGLRVHDPGLEAGREPQGEERRALKLLSPAMRDALQSQSNLTIGNDPAQLPAAKRAIEGLVFKAFSTDESFGRHLGNQLAFDRAEHERRSNGIRTVHGFADVGAVGVTNRELSRFGGDVVLTTVHATAAEVARDINQRKGLTGGEAIEVFAVGGDEIRFISSKTQHVRLFAKEFAEAMQRATIDGVAGDTPEAVKRVALSAIPVYVGIGQTKQAAEAQSNAAKASDPQRVPGQLPPGYRVEGIEAGDIRLTAGGGEPAAHRPIVDALAGTGWVEGGQLEAGVMAKLLGMQRELAAQFGLPQDDVPLRTAAMAAAWAHWNERAAVDTAAASRASELQAQLRTALEDLSPQQEAPSAQSAADAASAASPYDRYYRDSLTKPPRGELVRGMDAVRSSAQSNRHALDLGSGAGAATRAMLGNAGGFNVFAVDEDPAAAQHMHRVLQRYGNGRVQFVPDNISQASLPPTDLVWAGLSLPYLGPQGFAQTWPRITQAIRPGGVFAGDFFGERHWMKQQPDQGSFVFHDRAQVERLLDGLDLLELNEVDDQFRNDEGLWRTHVFSVVARKPGGEAAGPAAGGAESAQSLPAGWGVRTVIDTAGDGRFELTDRRGDAQTEMEVEGLRQGDGVARIVSMSAQDARLLARAEETMAQIKVTQVVVPRVRPQAEAFFTAAGYRPDAQSRTGGWVKNIGKAADIVAREQQRQQEAERALRARTDLQMMAGAGEEPAANKPILDALQGTDLLVNDQLEDSAMTRLLRAQREVAHQFGVQPEDVSMHAAALKAAELYWTAQVGHDDAAFDRARSVQSKLRVAVEALPRREVKPAPQSARSREGDAVAAVRPEEQVAALLADVPPSLRAQWARQLTGGPVLESLLTQQAKDGKPLTQDGVQALVSRNAPIVRPPQVARGETAPITFDSAYELPYGSRKEMQQLLRMALNQLPDEAMQLRTPDGERRFDLYRHGGGGYTMIDQGSGDAVPVAGDNDVVRAVTDSLGITRDDSGALVVSYGNTPAILADEPQFYLTREQIERMLALPADRRPPMTAQTVRAIDDLITLGEIGGVAPGVWNAAQHMPVVSLQTQAERALDDFQLLAYTMLGQQPSANPLIAAYVLENLPAARREAMLQALSQQARTIFAQFDRHDLARLPDLEAATEGLARLVTLADELAAARHPDTQRVRAMAVIARERILGEEAARLSSEP